MERGNFGGKRRPLKNIGTLCRHVCENSWTDRDAIWIVGWDSRTGPRNHELDGGSNPPWEGAILGERVAHCNILKLSAVSWADTAEPIDFPFGLWPRVDRWKNKFSRIRQVAPTWLWLNCPSAVAMQSYVKLLWPFVKHLAYDVQLSLYLAHVNWQWTVAQLFCSSPYM